MTGLDPSHSKLLGALTLTALEHLGGDTLTFDADNSLCQAEPQQWINTQFDAAR